MKKFHKIIFLILFFTGYLLPHHVFAFDDQVISIQDVRISADLFLINGNPLNIIWRNSNVDQISSDGILQTPADETIEIELHHHDKKKRHFNLR